MLTAGRVAEEEGERRARTVHRSQNHTVPRRRAIIRPADNTRKSRSPFGNQSLQLRAPSKFFTINVIDELCTITIVDRLAGFRRSKRRRRHRSFIASVRPVVVKGTRSRLYFHGRERTDAAPPRIDQFFFFHFSIVRFTDLSVSEVIMVVVDCAACGLLDGPGHKFYKFPADVQW